MREGEDLERKWKTRDREKGIHVMTLHILTKYDKLHVHVLVYTV